MKFFQIVISILVIFAAFSCTTTSPATNGNTGDQDTSRALEEMTTYFENAQVKMDEMAISEAISQLVAVLAIRNSINSPTEDMQVVAKKAETELTKIEAGLLLQPSAEWLDDNMDQVVSQTIAANMGKYLNPAVVLMYNVGGSRAAVSGAPVFFEFSKGSGIISLRTVTNEYGQAAAQLGKIDNPNTETVIQASIKYSVRGYTYNMNSMKREFVYRPATKRAAIIAMEKTTEKVMDDPLIFNTVFNKLKSIKYDFVPYGGTLLGDKFIKVFNGDIDAIKALTLDKNIPYLVLVLSDCYSIRQYRPGMQAYLAEAKGTIRIIRVSDGKILFEATAFVDRNHDNEAQANTPDTTMKEAFTLVAKEMDKVIEKELAAIKTALTAGE